MPLIASFRRLADIKSIAKQILCRVDDLEPALEERRTVLGVGEQTELLPLLEVLHALGRAHQIVRVEYREPSLAARDIHPGNLDVGVVDPIEHEFAADETLRRDPGFDDQCTSRPNVAGHAPNGTMQIVNRPRVADRSEHARDDVKSAGQVEVDKRALVQGDADTALSGNIEHLRAEIEPFHTKMTAEVLQVQPGTASDVEQGRCVRYDSLEDLAERQTRSRIVLPATERAQTRADWATRPSAFPRITPPNPRRGPWSAPRAGTPENTTFE